MKNNRKRPSIDPQKVERLVQEQLARERAEKARNAPPTTPLRKRDYIFKTGYYLFLFPVIWPYLQFKRSKEKIGDSAGQLRQFGRDLKANRDPWADDAPDMSDFRQVLKHWQIRKDEIDLVIRGLFRQILFFALLGLWGVYLLAEGSTLAQMNGAPLIWVSLVILITRSWRIQVLANRQFIYFKDWFLWGLFSWVGPETPFARNKRLEQEAQNE